MVCAHRDAAVISVIPVKETVRKFKNIVIPGRGRQPGNHERKLANRLAKRVFIGSGPDRRAVPERQLG